jgi:hypothetical protein
MCYELRDLRATVSAWLTDMGMQPQLSDEEGFPRRSGLLPYVSCLVALEECPLVIGIIDRQYGSRFKDWGPYTQYEDLAPTHAEIRHALDRKKKLLLYIHSSTLNFYQAWRKGGLTTLPKGLEESTLGLVKELKLHKPTPWIEPFDDAQGVIRSLQKNLINELYSALREQERQSTDLAKYILDLIAGAPAARNEIEAKLSPALRGQLDALQHRLEELEATRRLDQEASQQRLTEISAAKEAVEREIKKARDDLGKATATIVAAAIHDVGWLEMVRTRLMPKEPGRAPFHNDAEVAIRGYHCSNIRGKPVLREVTWARLAKVENKRHRGYDAGILFHGSNFAPGVTFTSRQVGETEPPKGRTDYWWRLPNIYFGEYLEVSCGNDELESPLSWRNTEFCVRNPQGETSEWVRFTYPYDEPRLRAVLAEEQTKGEVLYNEWRFEESVPFLRKAMVFSDRLDGSDHERTKHLTALWNNALDGSTLSKCRFREGDWIRIVRGEHAGVVAVIESLGRRHAKPYFFRVAESEPGWKGLRGASDEEVEAADPPASVRLPLRVHQGGEAAARDLREAHRGRGRAPHALQRWPRRPDDRAVRHLRARKPPAS